MTFLSIKNQKDKNLYFNGLPILIGNGFSIKFAKEFDYQNITDLIKNNSSANLKSLFDLYPNTNVEDLLNLIHDSQKIVGIASPQHKTDVIYKLNKIEDELRTGFINAVKTILAKSTPHHDLVFTEMGEDLKLFGDVFTTNYDTFLYYHILKKGYSDYFGNKNSNLIFRPEPRVTYKKFIYYLHGSLLFYEDNQATTKLKLQKNSDKTLPQIIEDKINNGDLPLIVADSNGEKKLKQIKASNYLNFCFDKFETHPSNSIVVYGHSLDKIKDSHILNAIKANFKTIYFGLYKHSDFTVEFYKELLNPLEIFFFDSSSIFEFNASEWVKR
jgi:hypothetical protein